MTEHFNELNDASINNVQNKNFSFRKIRYLVYKKIHPQNIPNVSVE